MTPINTGRRRYRRTQRAAGLRGAAGRGRGQRATDGDSVDASRSVAMTEHAVVIAGGGPTG
jgi:hypothetical protein